MSPNLKLIGAFFGLAFAGMVAKAEAGPIGPSDFLGNEQVQTFDGLGLGQGGFPGPLVLDGVSYDSSPTPGRNILYISTPCLSGECIGQASGDEWLITFDTP